MSNKLLSGLMETITSNCDRLSDADLNKLAFWCDRLNGNRSDDRTLQAKTLLMAKVLNARTNFRPINSLSLVESNEQEKGEKTA